MGRKQRSRRSPPSIERIKNETNASLAIANRGVACRQNPSEIDRLTNTPIYSGDDNINRQIDNAEIREKNVAFYTSLVDQWFENSNQDTLQYLIISAGAIVLLVTVVLSDKYKPDGYVSLILFLLSILSFTLSLLLSHKTFKLNVKYIDQLKDHFEDPENQPLPESIAWIDKWLLWTFRFAMICAVIFFLHFAWSLWHPFPAPAGKENTTKISQQHDPHNTP